MPPTKEWRRTGGCQYVTGWTWQTLGSQPIMPKNLPDHWLGASSSAKLRVVFITISQKLMFWEGSVSSFFTLHIKIKGTPNFGERGRRALTKMWLYEKELHGKLLKASRLDSLNQHRSLIWLVESVRSITWWKHFQSLTLLLSSTITFCNHGGCTYT